MANNEDDYLLISGLQNFAYCRRRWALVQIEGMWNENALTMEGHFMHERVHDSSFHEKRGRMLLSRGMPVVSHRLKITGECDMVELELSDDGVALVGRPGKYRIYPVEYKHGRPDVSGADELQLCAQAMCLEEMLCASILEGAVYYGELRRRISVPLTDELRKTAEASISEMHELMRRRYTPNVKRRKTCSSCSMHELCHPELLDGVSALKYMAKKLEEDTDA